MGEKGFVTAQGFCEFTFTNPALVHTRNNPGFFKGTVVEQAVADELAWKGPRPLRARKRIIMTSEVRNPMPKTKMRFWWFTPWLTRLSLNLSGPYRAYERLAE